MSEFGPLWSASKTRLEVSEIIGDVSPEDVSTVVSLRWHSVKLDDGRTVELFVNLDTNLVVLDVLDTPKRGKVRGGTEVFRQVI